VAKNNILQLIYRQNANQRIHTIHSDVLRQNRQEAAVTWRTHAVSWQRPATPSPRRSRRACARPSAYRVEST